MGLSEARSADAGHATGDAWFYEGDRPIRVLHSFPHKIGAARICMTAWHEVADAARAGADVTLFTGVVQRALPEEVRVRTTLSRGRIRIPYKAIGALRALALHDIVVARALPRLRDEIDIVHLWPLASLQTLRVSKRLGIPTVLERPNAHTRFAMEVVAAEGERIGVALPPDHEHAYSDMKLRKEEAEYELADRILCPSEFVVQTFRERGFPSEKLVRHIYGYDDTKFTPPKDGRPHPRGLNALFVGVCAVRKGLHFALEAWLRSPASTTGTFRIAGEFLPAYKEQLGDLLAHPSVEVLGHREDIPELMRQSDILLLPSIEEGFGLTCTEAIGSGCVPLVSDACTDTCVHGENALVHHVGDVDALAAHLTLLHDEPGELLRLREGAERSAPSLTWRVAGERLLSVYGGVVSELGTRARR